MAKVLYFILVTTFLPFSIVAQQTNRNGSVSVGASLTATDNSIPCLSPSGDFAFGFKRIQSEDDLFVLSIWYDKIPDKTIIWYPQTNAMVSRGSKIELVDGRGLVLSNPQGVEVWSSVSISSLAYGVMNDTGNFVLVGRNSSKIWESFNYPTNTLSPTQVMARGSKSSMYSKTSETNFSNGRFQLRLIPDGNLVLNTVDMFSNSPLDAYYVSGTFDPSNSTNSGERLIFDATGYMYIVRRNGERFDLTPRDAIPSGDYYHRATLDPDGVFTQYYYSKNPTGNTRWEAVWFKPDNMCNRLSDTVGSGACGLNSVCSLEANRPKCECPQGFTLVDSNVPNGDCNPDFTPSCDAGYRGDLFDFTELFDYDWPQSDYAHINPTDEQSCKSSCLEDCFCVVATYKDSQCWKKTLPLFNGKKDPSLNVKAFLKFKKGDVPLHSPPRFSGENKDKRSLIFVGPVLLSTSVSVFVILIGVIGVGFFLIYKKKARKNCSTSKVFMTNVPHFTYEELIKATNGFRDELGKGAFGIVYKGVIGMDMVAVKKLDRVIQDGEKEFQAEVNAIARTHHKNLVQLLGDCHDGDQRLLVYEYMSNGTLASFLFGEERASWKQRSHIALGIAKGLLYLHEECSTQVIHCDIKPQNILLDDYYNAKISDFGLAKLLMMNQSRTNTGIRGTKGYVAPEWFRNGPVTMKIDVYSYGVLLLEIISCRKSVKDIEGDDENGAILTDWAWDCYQERVLDAFVENDSEALDDYKKLTTFVMVGLWCVQENPSLRPTMRKVIQMLEGVIEVSEPSCPFPFSVTSS